MKPPPAVELTLGGVMTVLKKPPTWEESKKQMGDPSFLDSLLRYNRDLLDDVLLKKINRYTTNPDFTPEVICSSHTHPSCEWA
jgi:dynein heavy chain, axonemal